MLFINFTDGDATSFPLIFEDRYQDSANLNRRRTESDPHINGHCSKNKSPTFNNNSIATMDGIKMKECSCGINNYSMEPLPKLNTSSLIGVMTPRFALGGDVLQASLTIIPSAAHNGLRGKTLSRHSVANVLESESQWEWFEESLICGNGGTLPSRHSKSLDQLESQNLTVNSLPHHNSTKHQQINPTTKLKSPSVTYYQHKLNSKNNATAEDLLKNINEFKEKYKNYVDSTKTLAQLTNDFHPKKLVNGTLVHQTSIFPKEIHLNGNVQNRNIKASNSPKTDYVRELKRNNFNYQNSGIGNKNQHSCYYNSLPKHAGMGASQKNTFPSVRVKKSGKSISKSPKGNKLNLNTIPRSNSSQALRKSGKFNELKKINGSNADESSSTDQSTAITPKRRSKKMLSSRSVPFKLELLETENTGFSESLPNLAPPPAFSNSPLSMKSRNRKSCSESTSSLSEQSGWVSSNRSSLPSSPEVLKNDRVFNGERLRQKLLKLLEQQPLRKDLDEQKRSTGRVVKSFSSQKRHSSGNAIERNKSLTFNGKSSSAWENSQADSVDVSNITLSTQKQTYKIRQSTLDSKANHRARKQEKSKSDFDLTNLPMDQPFEDLRLPPPQEFCDAASFALPPDEFRDPPSINEETRPVVKKKSSAQLVIGKQSMLHAPLIQQQSNPVHSQAMDFPPQVIEAIDNPLYHVYEIKRRPGPARPFVKSQSNNELLGMVRAASVNEKVTQLHQTRLKSFSKPSSPDSYDRYESETKKESPMMLMEFEKCREEFRKQINYSG